MPLPPAESRLHAALREYLEAVGLGRAGSPHPAWTERLQSTMVGLERLEAELSADLDPQLRHFLESKSYRKAYDHLSALASSGLANDPPRRQNCSR